MTRIQDAVDGIRDNGGLPVLVRFTPEGLTETKNEVAATGRMDINHRDGRAVWEWGNMAIYDVPFEVEA